MHCFAVALHVPRKIGGVRLSEPFRDTHFGCDQLTRAVCRAFRHFGAAVTGTVSVPRSNGGMTQSDRQDLAK